MAEPEYESTIVGTNELHPVFIGALVLMSFIGGKMLLLLLELCSRAVQESNRISDKVASRQKRQSEGSESDSKLHDASDCPDPKIMRRRIHNASLRGAPGGEDNAKAYSGDLLFGGGAYTQELSVVHGAKVHALNVRSRDVATMCIHNVFLRKQPDWDGLGIQSTNQDEQLIGEAHLASLRAHPRSREDLRVHNPDLRAPGNLYAGSLLFDTERGDEETHVIEAHAAGASATIRCLARTRIHNPSLRDGSMCPGDLLANNGDRQPHQEPSEGVASQHRKNTPSDGTGVAPKAERHGETVPADVPLGDEEQEDAPPARAPAAMDTVQRFSPADLETHYISERMPQMPVPVWS